MYRKDTQWQCLLRGDTFTIPTGFIADLLDGKVDALPVYEMEAVDHHDERYKRHALDRLNPAVIDRTLRYADYDDMVARLAGNLTTIVHRHSEHGDYYDINYASSVIHGLGLERNEALIAYFSGSGLCMHVASLGVAIARVNGVEAEVVGHKWYYAGPYGYLRNSLVPAVIWFRERIGRPIPSYMHSFMMNPYHHYGIRLKSPSGESKVIIPRGRWRRRIIRNRRFESIQEMT